MPSVVTVDSPVGTLSLIVSEGAVSELRMDAVALPDEAGGELQDRSVMAEATAQLEAYFAGSLQSFDLPLRPKGTTFQHAVWRELERIPYGTVASYGEIARRVGKPTASRAIGSANGRNPIAIIVPCHRVIGADGTLTGYGGGLWRKAWLLEHERTFARARGQLALVPALSAAAAAA
jgi:methylated-DNA-[protein]-cysteine S-methyltransferase